MHLSELILTNWRWPRNLYLWFRKPRTQRIFRVSWISLALIFLAVYVARNWSAFATQSWQISWRELLLAGCFALFRKFMGGLQWGLISRYRRDNRLMAEFLKDLRVYFLSNLAAYIPGSVWLLASRVQLNSQRGASVLVTSASMVGETTLFVWSSCLVGSYTAIQLFPDRSLEIGIAILGLVVLSLIAIHPSIAQAVSVRLDRWLNKRSEFCIKVTYLDGLFLLAVAVIVWVAGGVSHFLLARAFHSDLSFRVIPNITSAFALAWTIGYLTPVAPAGLGVRDGILVALFSMWMPNPVAVVVMLASRVLLALEDIVWAIVASYTFSAIGLEERR